ncbi:mechanosensitive ion channel protein MscS [Nocardiopsis terrae]|uniref:Small conductance mechanosensitive channel n=1 Tax=Nocardiopsis terrae TaxID=372655 RepID=A0ABR9HGR1_9ACTN|nr:mechanosensitive ion channel family protein [Nocardiopsis terrae]MBE1458215.1 small conductance mechanosensitive channel [Nocardiopsis terrae]GHC81599.1 mechanosensitive ion channel protein MscS [Nocardiopsis terrae]
MAPAELDLVNSEAVDQATAALPAWLQDNLDLLIGVPLRILLIIVGALIVRALARRAISRLMERVLRPGDSRNGQRRPARGPAVLQRDPSRADERRQQRAKTLGSVLGSFASIVIVATALAMVLGEVGIALGPLLASAGVVGLAIGFGAQSLVADYLSGLLIMAEDQYGVGDVVDLGEAVGEVENVGLRLTQVRDINGGLWHIRNGEIQRVRNDSQGWARAVLDVSVAYESDLEKVYAVLEQTGRDMREDPEFGKLLLEDPSVWGVQSLDADGVVVRMAAKTVPLEQWGVTRELRRRVKAALDSSGIEIPFPQRTVWMRSGDGSAV